jgi:ABC-type uncharacterized transport system permease subunit
MIDSVIAPGLVAIFAALALVHVYWAFGGRAMKMGAIPQVAGRRAFSPSPIATLAVAFALLAAGLVISAVAEIIHAPVPHQILDTLIFGLALVLFARAIGDFRLVRFFKKVRGTPFARLDSAFYSPLCLALAVAVFLVGWEHAG